MRKHVLVLTTTATILAFGANAAIAQAPGAEAPSIPSPSDHGMMGGGHHDGSLGRDIMGPVMARIISSLMDADGDGKLTLQEWQAADERIFKAMDTHFQTFAKVQGGAMLDVPLALNVSLGHQPTKSCSGLGPLISQRRTYGGRSRNVDDVA